MSDKFELMQEKLNVANEKVESFTYQGAARVIMSKYSYKTNEKIVFTFWTNGVKVASNAWIGIVPASIPHGSESTNDGHDKSFKYLSGKTTATFDLRNPGRGKWTVRFHDTDSGGQEIAFASFVVS